MRYVSVTPAYGVDYKTQAEVKQAYDDGRDFKVHDYELHGYVNKNDKPSDVALVVRYNKSSRTMIIGEKDD